MSDILMTLMGPTASGKTDLALYLADHYPIDLISVDSALIYRGMNIGTAKPSPQILTRYPHALIDICDPADTYSAAQFCLDANTQIQQSLANHRIPLLVGGTMLYFHLLFQGISPLPTRNEQIRADIDARAQKIGWAALHEELALIDPISAQRIHPNDPQRLQRALEVYYASGKTMSDWFLENSTGLSLPILNIALSPTDRQLLHQRIETRFRNMLEQGLVEEVRALHARGDLSEQCSSIRAVGYRQVWQYLNHEMDYATMMEKAICASRQLAKRQITWLRKWPDLHWFDSEDPQLREKVRVLMGDVGL